MKRLIGMQFCLNFWSLFALCMAVVLCNATSASAGIMHARAVLNLIPNSDSKPHNGVAHAVRENDKKTKYRVAHAQLGLYSTYGNAGSGHAHHHGLFGLSSDSVMPFDHIVPIPGSLGTSQYILITSESNATDDEITVAWSSDSFLQIDLSELVPGYSVSNRASLTADGGLFGSVELSAYLNDKSIPQINTSLTGIFEGLAFGLVSYPGDIVLLKLRNPVSWTVPGNSDSFEIALDASIEEVSVPEPNTLFLLSTGLVGMLGYAWRRRQPQGDAKNV